MSSEPFLRLRGGDGESDHDLDMIHIDPPRAAWTEGDLVRALESEATGTRELIQAIAAAVVLAPALAHDASIEDALALARRVRAVLIPDDSPDPTT